MTRLLRLLGLVTVEEAVQSYDAGRRDGLHVAIDFHTEASDDAFRRANSYGGNTVEHMTWAHIGRSHRDYAEAIRIRGGID